MKPNNKKIVLHFVIIALFSYSPFSTFSQNTFDTIYDLSLYDHRAYDIAETRENSFIIAGAFVNDANAPICKVDSTGVLLWTKYYSFNGYTQISDLAVNENGSIFVIGTYLNSDRRSYIMKLNSEGDSLGSKKYFYNNNTYFGNFIYGFDDKMTIICSIDYPAYSQTVKLINVDSTGEILGETSVIENDTSHNYCTFGLLQLPDSSFFMNGSYHYSDYNYKPFMARVSATGELLYTRLHELPWPEGSAMVNGICPDGNGNVMNCAGFTPNPAAMNGIWMIKTNSNGDTLWTRAITLEGTSYGPMSVSLCSDGGYAVAGNYYTNYTPTSVETGAFIMRTDSLANPLWIRTYASDKNGFFYEIIEASDQGLAATGVASPSPGHQAFYLVKTDTAGLITSTWQPGAVADRLTVSPNPVADVCRVTLPEGCRQLTLLTLHGQTLSTFNTTGKSTLELSTNWLPAGLYLLRAETSTMRTTEKIVKYAR